MYCIRIDNREGYAEQIVTVFSQPRYTKVLSVRHEGRKGNNSHFHITVKTDYKTQALRAELKKHFDLGKGNGHMSIKPWDGDSKANSYLFHERQDTPIVLNKGYTDKDITLFQKQNERIQEQIAENTPTNICKHITRLMIETVPYTPRDQYDRDEGHYNATVCPPKTIIFALWDYYKSRGEWFPNKYQLDRYVYMIQASYAEYHAKGTDDSWQSLKTSWYNTMYPEKFRY